MISPESWSESTETKTVDEENDIVYHFYSVSNENDQNQGVVDQVMVIRYLEGDPCAGMEVTKTDTIVSGYKAQKNDCFMNGKLKVTQYSFPNTRREEWFLVAYFEKDVGMVEKIAATFTFLD